MYKNKRNCRNCRNCNLKSSSESLPSCEGKSTFGFDRFEAGYKWDCKAYSQKPEDWWIEDNNADINFKWNIDPDAFNAQREYVRKKCDQIYNAPWIGNNVICNGTPKAYWGTVDGKFVPDNGGDYLWWQCQPGDRCN